jgi:hypothetical protein
LGIRGSASWRGRFSPATLEIPIATPGVAEDWQIQALAILKDQPVGTASDFVQVLVRG